MIQEKGTISVNADNIFPIIKKWLYSEKDIFIRELVSNASDAISKLRKLGNIGEAKLDESEKFQVRVRFNPNEKTIEITDNGIGMTEEEVKKYINQVAFSGAKDFLEKYKDKADENQIIGHFGLGFYSSFMVADKVRIDTLSYQPGAEAVRWESVGGTEFEITASDRDAKGTTVTLFVGDDSVEYLDEAKIRQTLVKYFSFLPYELYLEDTTKKVEDEKPINDTQPLWQKNPKDCTEEEYKAFYHKVFMDMHPPLFWIHLNMDYPVRLQGILYFPKVRFGYETIDGQIKLYYNQVFVADNIKEVIPDFLMLLKGTIDCPDLPLNVSRSFLQNDGYVNKISSHIIKKVADKLIMLFDTERENYNKYWDDINPFVKYGCVKEAKFYDRMKDVLIFKTINNEHLTLSQYLENAKEKHENKVFYVSDDRQQAQYIKMFKESGLDAVLLNNMIDNHYMHILEEKNSGVKFQRIDSELSDTMKEENTEDVKDLQEKVESIFRQALSDDKLKVKLEALKSESISCMILLDESTRRMTEMNMMFAQGFDTSFLLAGERTLVVNNKNRLVKALIDMSGNESRKDDVNLICAQLFDIALMSYEALKPDAMTVFIERSNKIMEMFINK